MFVARGNLQTFPFPFLGKLPTLPNNCTELMPETFKKYESVCFSNLSEIHLSLLFNVKNHFECTWEMSQPRLSKSPFQVSFMTRRVFLWKGLCQLATCQIYRWIFGPRCNWGVCHQSSQCQAHIETTLL